MLYALRSPYLFIEFYLCINFFFWSNVSPISQSSLLILWALCTHVLCTFIKHLCCSFWPTAVTQVSALPTTATQFWFFSRAQPHAQWKVSPLGLFSVFFLLYTIVYFHEICTEVIILNYWFFSYGFFASGTHLLWGPSQSVACIILLAYNVTIYTIWPPCL